MHWCRITLSGFIMSNNHQRTPGKLVRIRWRRWGMLLQLPALSGWRDRFHSALKLTQTLSNSETVICDAQRARRALISTCMHTRLIMKSLFINFLPVCTDVVGSCPFKTSLCLMPQRQQQSEICGITELWRHCDRLTACTYFSHCYTELLWIIIIRMSQKTP